MSASRYGEEGIEGVVWNEYFGNSDIGEDAFGHQIEWEEYGEEGETSWNIDHVWPVKPLTNNRKGSDYYTNLQPLCTYCNNEKSNWMSGVIDNQKFSIISAGERTSSNGAKKMIGRLLVDGEVKTNF